MECRRCYEEISFIQWVNSDCPIPETIGKVRHTVTPRTGMLAEQDIRDAYGRMLNEMQYSRTQP